jgi:general secretion pathway protein G
MTQSPESTTPPGGERHIVHLVHKVLLWCSAIIAAVGLTLFWCVNHLLSRHETDGTRIIVLEILRKPLDAYKRDNGDYPTTAQGLQALLTPPPGLEKTWAGPYLDLTPPDKMMPDRWRHAYRYAYPSIHVSTASTNYGPDGLPRPRQPYDIWSLGPDGIDGTADDIGNW